MSKVSIRTQSDGSFPSSQVPSGKVRHTFMVRNAKRHKKTYGWGYALFDPNGKPYDGDHNAKTMACAACHQIVKDQGQVFSKPMGLPFKVGSSSDWKSRIDFKATSIAQVPQTVQNEIGSKFKKIHLIQGALQKHLFFGTLDEVRPILLEKAKSVNVPTGLISNDGSQYSIVVPTNSKACAGGQSFKAFHTLPKGKAKLYKLDLCLNE